MRRDEIDKSIKEILKKKPDEMQALEMVNSLRQWAAMLSNELKSATARWEESFVILGTVLNKYGKEIRLTEDDMIPLSVHDYAITVELDDKTNERVIRLRYRSELSGNNTGKDD